jgi:Ni/Co efflux regulator RcnB
MRSGIGLAAAAALGVALLAIGNVAATAAPASRGHGVTRSADVAVATDLSARRRAHRHHHRTYRVSKHPSYYARPSYYRPGGMAPFFPFHYGYGLEPSW